MPSALAQVPAGLACGLLIAGAAEAKIVQCKALAQGYTVFLSEPVNSSAALASKDQVRAFLDHLWFELDQHRDAEWIESPSSKVSFVVCSDRAPEPDGREFVASIVDNLYMDRVLLEIWGRLDLQRQGEQPPELQAQMNYLIVPLQYASNRSEQVPAALQRLEYPDTEAAKKTTDFVALIARPLDIDAFVAAAFGFKLLREHGYDLAHQNLCRAAALLHRIEERPSLSKRIRKNVAELRAFVIESAARAIREAAADAAYPAVGLLRLQDANLPCAGED